MPTSPGGSIFPYYYKNGELFGVHFGSFFSDSERLIALMKSEEDFFLRQNRSIPFWVDFYETKLTGWVLAEFIGMLQRIHPRVTKLAIVGCSAIDRWRLNRLIRQTGALAALPIRYFRDPEDAKTWLVTEAS